MIDLRYYVYKSYTIDVIFLSLLILIYHSDFHLYVQELPSHKDKIE